jgi:hypothetical protein
VRPRMPWSWTFKKFNHYSNMAACIQRSTIKKSGRCFDYFFGQFGQLFPYVSR